MKATLQKIKAQPYNVLVNDYQKSDLAKYSTSNQKASQRIWNLKSNITLTLNKMRLKCYTLNKCHVIKLFPMNSNFSVKNATSCLIVNLINE